MESRKLIKFGNSSYVLTVPNDWVKLNELKKGDEINITKRDDMLLISLNKNKGNKIANIDIDYLPFKLFNKWLMAHYLRNYKFIKIKGDTVLNKLDEIKRFKEKLSSLEIVEITDSYVKLEDFSNPDKLNLDHLVNEIIKMEVLIFNSLITYKKDSNFYFISSLDANINKLSFLCFKAINYHLEYGGNDKIAIHSVHNWRMVSSLEAIGDILKRLARYIKQEGNNYLGANMISLVSNLKDFYLFITGLIGNRSGLEKNLALYADKKQSMLKEIEIIKKSQDQNLTINLVYMQLFKDLIGQLDRIVVSIIDLAE